MPDDLLDTTVDDAGAGAADSGAGGDAGSGAGAGAGKAAADAGASGKQGSGKPDAGASADRGAADAGKAGAADGKSAAKAETSDDDGEVDLGLDDEGGDAKARAAALFSEDNWREKIAGQDEKWLKELQRFSNFSTFIKSQRALRQKLSSGEYRRAALPDDASDAEKAEWRKQQGIPDKPEDYGLPEVKGFEWGDKDKPIVTGFLADLHKAGASKPVAEQALKWYAGFAQQQAEARVDLDRQAKDTREDTLRNEWAPGEYRQHVNLAKQTLNDNSFMPKPLRQALASARTGDGRRLIDVPELTIWLAERGLERRGPAGLISGEQGARMGSRIEEIKKIMATDFDRYSSKNLGSELQKLMDQQESMGSRRSA